MIKAAQSEVLTDAVTTKQRCVREQGCEVALEAGGLAARPALPACAPRIRPTSLSHGDLLKGVNEKRARTASTTWLNKKLQCSL